VCYSIYLSTDSKADLSAENSELVSFLKEPVPEPYQSLLEYPQHWYAGSMSGCSCTFRHLYSVELGFSEPVDWYEEGEDEIAATLLFIKVIRQLSKLGFQVDCVDTWYGAGRDDIAELIVNLDHITDEQFRFFENYHFVFGSGV
jgi:hypothetical protein